MSKRLLWPNKQRRDQKRQHDASHTGELNSEAVALEVLLKAELCAACDFSGKVATDTPGCDTANAAGFHQWTTGSVTIVLPHSAIDCHLTDIYLNENLRDYIFKERRTDRRRDGFRLHQVLIDLSSVFIVIHAVIQILLILHPLLTATHMTEYGTDMTLHHTAVSSGVLLRVGNGFHSS